MPNKQASHKPINIRLETYQQILAITDQLAKEKNVPVTIPTTVQLLVDKWMEGEKMSSAEAN